MKLNALHERETNSPINLLWFLGPQVEGQPKGCASEKHVVQCQLVPVLDVKGEVLKQT